MLKFYSSNAGPEVASRLRSQWANPSNILDLLLLVGGDIIAIALAQLTGSHWYRPNPRGVFIRMGRLRVQADCDHLRPRPSAHADRRAVHGHQRAERLCQK